jgi:predicted Zn-dependent peptidase
VVRARVDCAAVPLIHAMDRRGKKANMPSHFCATLLTGFCSTALLCIFPGSSQAGDPQIESRTLENGLRVVYIFVPGSRTFSMFSLLPMGLAADDAGRAQWAHLVEHLVIRTTMPDSLTQANAETLADHMRLDYYAKDGNWREALAHHERWLRGLPFTEDRLKVEVALANAEAENTARNLASLKFAIAAWNQAYRHGKKHAAILKDLLEARLADLQQYRDAHLLVPGRTLVCAIGGAEPKAILPAIAEALGGLKSASLPRQAIPKLRPMDATIPWDLPSRHLLYVWPIPGPEQPNDYAALLTASHLISMQAAQNPALGRFTGALLADANLTSPEGRHFCISATLRPDAEVEAVRHEFDKCLAALTTSPETRQVIPLVARGVAEQFKPTALQTLRGQVTDPGQAWLVEAQFALTWATGELQLGPQRRAVLRSLDKVTPETLTRAVRTYLTPERRTVLMFVPSPHSQENPKKEAPEGPHRP